MTRDLQTEVAAALRATPHADDCATRGEVNPEAPCDCDRDDAIAQRVYAAIVAAWRYNPYSRNTDDVLAALRGGRAVVDSEALPNVSR